LRSLDREGAPHAVLAWGLFRIPKGLKCVERREAGEGLEYMHPKPSSLSGRIVASLDRKCLGQKSVRESGTWLRGIFDKETRRKPLAVAADALSYGD
jgi:hypothetical protein